MKGSIRVVLGLLIAFGAVGTLDVNPEANVALQVAVATLGLAVMYSGARAVNEALANG